MDIYNDKTEELVSMFLSFSDKKYINADDFIKIRKQVVKEINKENGRYGNNVIYPLMQQGRADKGKEAKVSQPYPDKPKEENNVQDIGIGKLDTEKMFLSMVKELQD